MTYHILRRILSSVHIRIHFNLLCLSRQVHVVEHIMRLFPDAPKYMIGFSCGANLAINYLAHVGKSSPFIASASVSNGYNILKGEKESLNI